METNTKKAEINKVEQRKPSALQTFQSMKGIIKKCKDAEWLTIEELTQLEKIKNKLLEKVMGGLGL